MTTPVGLIVLRVDGTHVNCSFLIKQTSGDDRQKHLHRLKRPGPRHK